jgi:signal transduction histidine kinase
VRTHTLVGRLVLTQQILTVVLIAAFAGLTLWISSRTLARQETADLTDVAQRLVARLEHELDDEGTLERATAGVMEDEVPTGVWVDVFDSFGHRVNEGGAGGRRPEPRDTRSMRVPLSRGGFVVFSVSTRPRRDSVAALAWALLIASVLLLSIAPLATRFTARHELLPLSRLTSKIAEVSDMGALKPLTSAEDPAEIVTLSSAFDRLVGRLAGMLRAEGHFTRDAAHELRTPLTVMSGEIELALSSGSLPDSLRHGLQSACEQARAMSALVEALLLLRRADLATSESPVELPVLDLGALAREVADEAQRLEPSRYSDLQMTITHGVRVRGDRALIAAAIRNLLGNGFKFTRPGEPIRLSVFASPEGASLVVEDGGPGIPPEDQCRIFDPFFRSAEARAHQDGLGLGLPIVERIARAHGGALTLSTSTLGGARFELRIPRSSTGSQGASPDA